MTNQRPPYRSRRTLLRPVQSCSVCQKPNTGTSLLLKFVAYPSALNAVCNACFFSTELRTKSLGNALRTTTTILIYFLSFYEMSFVHLRVLLFNWVRGVARHAAAEEYSTLRSSRPPRLVPPTGVLLQPATVSPVAARQPHIPSAALASPEQGWASPTDMASIQTLRIVRHKTEPRQPEAMQVKFARLTREKVLRNQASPGGPGYPPDRRTAGGQVRSGPERWWAKSSRSGCLVVKPYVSLQEVVAN